MNGWSDKFLTGKNKENISCRVDNMLEYFSVFLLYTDMYVHYKRIFQTGGTLRPLHLDHAENGANTQRSICDPQRLAKRKIQERAIYIP